MTTKIGEIAGKHFHSFLELREFAAPDGTPGLQLTPMGAVYVQMSPDDVLRLAAVLTTWAESRMTPIETCGKRDDGHEQYCGYPYQQCTCERND